MNAVNIKPYTIIEKHSLGIIGVITPDTKGKSMSFPADGTGDSVPSELQGQAVELAKEPSSAILSLPSRKQSTS